MAKRKKDIKDIPYTKEEKEMIMKAKGAAELKEIAFLLGRDYDSLRVRQWKWRNKEYSVQKESEYKKKRERKLSPEGRRYQYWSKMEEDLILTSTKSDYDLAVQLNRTVGAIQAKRIRLLEERSKG
jgi:hypothetical protein